MAARGQSSCGVPGRCWPPRSRPGVTTERAGRLAEKFIRRRGGVPTFKGYRGFPGSICASPNDMVVHGIPGKYRVARRRHPGRRRGRDAGRLRRRRGHHGRQVGRDRRRPRACCEVTAESLEAGIAQCRVGNRLGDISHAVQEVVRSRTGSPWCGAGRPRRRPRDARGPADAQLRRRPAAGRGCEEGMVFAIEPMVNVGGYEVYDGATTAGPSTPRTAVLSAHFEHTVAITARRAPRPDASPLGASGASGSSAGGAAGRCNGTDGRLCRQSSCGSMSGRCLSTSREYGAQRRSHRARRRGRRGPAQHDVPGEARQRPRGARSHLGQDAHELHPHPARRQGQGRAVALRPAAEAGSRIGSSSGRSGRPEVARGRHGAARSSEDHR